MKKITALLCMSILCISFLFSSYSMTIRASSAKKTGISNDTKNDISATEFVRNMKIGWNLGNSLDSHYGEATGDGNLSQETIWGNPKVTKEQIDYVKSLGFDVIRVPVTWHTHIYRDKNGALHIHKDWLKRVSEVVDYCISDDLYVIINIHHDGKLIHAGVDEKEFSQIKADATSLWTEIASYFSTYDEHLIFESYNEVDNYEAYWNYGEKAATQMNDLNQLFVDLVRKSGKNNATRMLMVPTLLHGTGEKFQNGYRLPSDKADDKLIVSVHNYSQNFDQSLESQFTSLQTFSKKIGAPVIIDEWGTTESYAPSEYRSIHAANYIARSSAHGIKCVYWDNGSDYAIVNRKTLLCNEAMISSLMSPKAYKSDNLSSISSWDKFMYMSIDQTTGALIEDTSWGSIMVNQNGKGAYPIPKGKKTIYVGLFAKSNMAEQRIHCVYFFDSNDKLLDKISDWNGFTEKHIDIPAGSSYARIMINSAKSSTSSEDYQRAVESGNFAVLINFY